MITISNPTVKNNYVEEVSLKSVIWDDRGSGADTGISVYDIRNTTTSLSMGLFYAKTGYDHYNTIQSTRVYALKQSKNHV